MITYLYKRIVASGWAPEYPDPEDCMGVLVRKARGVYVTMPSPINNLLLEANVKLNLMNALTMRPQMLEGILETLTPGQAEIRFADNSQLQILDSIADVEAGTVKQFQYAAICREERLILVWHDDITNLIAQAQKTEERLLSLVWGDRSLFSILQAPTRPASPHFSMAPSSGAATPYFEKKAPVVTEMEKQPEEELLEIERPESLQRPVIRVSPVFTGLAVCLGICLLGGVFVGKVVREVMLDGNYTRLALCAVVPLLFFISLFFFNTIFAGLFQMIGPISGAFTNSRYYSPHKPNMHKAYAEGFVPPKVSIQMPVYKEGLESVIVPTVRSLQAAISYYESRGGSANIFINDDGLRAGISEEDIRARREFYEDNNIGGL